ncbi:MAG: protein-disulfide reductase DsbD N-terminal domain-containing protein [Candidatus Moduliflexus flocculans]|nr:protein-disulfide reductase DsbD N-terminal domain-containing protein [Candidatus Moduliflexus flocculans]
MTWSLPPGVMAAGLEWPAPERIDIGGLVNYGYHNSGRPAGGGCRRGRRADPAGAYRQGRRCAGWPAPTSACPARRTSR